MKRLLCSVKIERFWKHDVMLLMAGNVQLYDAVKIIISSKKILSVCVLIMNFTISNICLCKNKIYLMLFVIIHCDFVFFTDIIPSFSSIAKLSNNKLVKAMWIRYQK